MEGEPKTAWSHRVVVVGIVVSGLLTALVLMAQSGDLAGGVVALLLFSAALQTALGLALLRWPIVAAFAVFGAVAISAVLVGNAFIAQAPIFLPIAFHLGRQTTLRRAAAVLAVQMALLVALFTVVHDNGISSATPQGLAITGLATGTLLLVLPAVAGQSVRWQDDRWEMAMRLVEAERRQKQDAVDRALTAERARMTRELHDVAAHHMTAVIINAKAAARMADSGREDGAHATAEVGEILGEVVDEASRATSSLREVVGLLRENEGGERVPVRTLADVPALVEQARRVNPGVQLTGDLDLVLSPAAGLAAYRIVQEALTNAHRYAPGAEVEVNIDRGPTDITVSIVNGPPTEPAPTGLGSRLGISGMQSRARSLGGSLEAGPRHGGWRVVLRLSGSYADEMSPPGRGRQDGAADRAEAPTRRSDAPDEPASGTID